MWECILHGPLAWLRFPGMSVERGRNVELGMSVEPEDRFELPRKFHAGVIRRKRCGRTDVEAISVAEAASDAWRVIDDRVVAQDGPAAAVREFAEFSAQGVSPAGHRWAAAAASMTASFPTNAGL